MREKENAEQEFYTVTEAVQKTGVASHVLRYWEDELGITIKRTTLGHRIYSEEDLALFLRVKALKEKGIQLKAIRLMLDESAKGEESFRPERLFGGAVGMQTERTYKRTAGCAGAEEDAAADASMDVGMSTNMQDNREGMQMENEAVPPDGSEYEVIPSAETDNYLRFEMMLRDLVSEAVGEQNEKLKQEIADILRDEIENLYIQLQQEDGLREAASARTGRTASDGRTAFTGHVRIGLLERIRRMFHVSL